MDPNVALRNGRAETALRAFYCHGCGRRLLHYTPDALGAQACVRVRCRDCKTTSELRGADVAGLLHALSHGKGD
jgi:hypothetical protein